MAYHKTPSYLWPHLSGLWHLKRPIPPGLQCHFVNPETGKPRTHIVESLGTHNRAEAEQKKRPRLRQIEVEFAALRSGLAQPLPAAQTAALHRIREDMKEAMEAQGKEVDNPPRDDTTRHEDNIEALQNAALEVALTIEGERGFEAAQAAYTLATSPDKMTLKAALSERHKVASLRNQTKVAEDTALRELLDFLKVADCLPEKVSEKNAQSFVDLLNSGPRSFATRKGKLSCLARLWATRRVKQQLSKAQRDIWLGHDLKGKKKSTDEQGDDTKRAWHPAEIVRLFTAAAPIDMRERTYTRSLFLQLYTLGFITGMRLDEITSLRPRDLAEITGGLAITVRKAKRASSLRTIPVVHPAAVSILKARKAQQADPGGMLFSECASGGYDSKTSAHVQKAMTNERKRLKFTATDFHSTRRSFMTLLENAGTDVVMSMRYVGHRVPTLFHGTYSDGATVATLRQIADVVRYPADVEPLFAKVAADLSAGT